MSKKYLLDTNILVHLPRPSWRCRAHRTGWMGQLTHIRDNDDRVALWRGSQQEQGAERG